MLTNTQRLKNSQKKFNDKNVTEHEVIDGMSFYRPTNSGLYAVFPFYDVEKRNGDEFGMFKLGIATSSFNSRIQAYHTYFPAGVSYCALLHVIPFAVPANHKDFSVFYTQYKKDLNVIEKRAFTIIQSLKGVVLKNNLRKRNESNTEWVYTSLKAVNECFRILKNELEKDNFFAKKYKFKLEETDTLELEKWVKEMNKNKNNKIVKQTLLYNLGNNSFLKNK